MTLNKQEKIVVILGPTASGKSDLAVQLAKKFNGEVVSADSRQVYKSMDIGTGKVPKDKSKIKNQKSKLQIKSKKSNNYYYEGVRHHLLDVVSPKTQFDVVRYQKMARKKITDILKHGKLPIICGGTGLYIKAIVENPSYPNIPPDWDLRKNLERKTTKELFTMLKKLDPKRAKIIDKKNPRRLIRAIEIARQIGRARQNFLKENLGGQVPQEIKQPQYNALLIGIKKSPEELRKAIAVRLYKRMRQGMVAEVKKLHAQGISWKRLEEFGLEYKYIALYLQNKIDKQAVLETLETKINQYAKRQMTWFKKTPDIHWIKNKKEAEKLIQSHSPPGKH